MCYSYTLPCNYWISLFSMESSASLQQQNAQPVQNWQFRLVRSWFKGKRMHVERQMLLEIWVVKRTIWLCWPSLTEPLCLWIADVWNHFIRELRPTASQGHPGSRTLHLAFCQDTLQGWKNVWTLPCLWFKGCAGFRLGRCDTIYTGLNEVWSNQKTQLCWPTDSCKLFTVLCSSLCNMIRQHITPVLLWPLFCFVLFPLN